MPLPVFERLETGALALRASLLVFMHWLAPRMRAASGRFLVPLLWTMLAGTYLGAESLVEAWSHMVNSVGPWIGLGPEARLAAGDAVVRAVLPWSTEAGLIALCVFVPNFALLVFRVARLFYALPEPLMRTIGDVSNEILGSLHRIVRRTLEEPKRVAGATGLALLTAVAVNGVKIADNYVDGLSVAWAEHERTVRLQTVAEWQLDQMRGQLEGLDDRIAGLERPLHIRIELPERRSPLSTDPTGTLERARGQGNPNFEHLKLTTAPTRVPAMNELRLAEVLDALRRECREEALAIFDRERSADSFWRRALRSAGVLETRNPAEAINTRCDPRRIETPEAVLRRLLERPLPPASEEEGHPTNPKTGVVAESTQS